MSYRTVSASFLEKRYWKEAGRNKKAGRIPVYDDVGSAKNPLPERQRNAQQDTKTQWSLLVFRCLGAKELFLKLGGFTSSFAEITDEMSTEVGFRGGGVRFQNTIYPHVVRKSRRFPAFFGVFIKSREKGRFASPRCWGRLRRLGSLVHARHHLLFAARRERQGIEIE